MSIFTAPNLGYESKIRFLPISFLRFLYPILGVTGPERHNKPLCGVPAKP